MAIDIRRAGPGDVGAIVGLVRAMAAEEDYPSDIDEDYAGRFLASPRAGVLLAEDDGATIGLVSYVMVPGLFHAGDSGLLELLFVAADRRDEGIGGRLVRAALGILEDAGCAEISVSTGPDNGIAQKLYVDAGLTEASVLLEKHVRR
jgi:ribosomal protein S18 acetylase RimI-like enzyme